MRNMILTGVALGLLSTSALAADLPSRVVTPTMIPPVPAVNWNGLYVGVNVGYGGDTYAYPFAITGGGRTANSFNYALTSSGILGGGQIGYNLAVPGIVLPYDGGLVFGAEADYDAASIGGNAQLSGVSPVAGGAGTGSVGTKLTSFGTVRGRGGLSFGRLLVYGTGGFAYGQARSNTSVTLGGVGAVYSANVSHTGTTFGGGAEFLVTPNISFKIEYLRATLDTKVIAAGTVGARSYTISERPSDTIVRGGLNYKFDFFRPIAPVVAAY